VNGPYGLAMLFYTEGMYGRVATFEKDMELGVGVESGAYGACGSGKTCHGKE